MENVVIPTSKKNQTEFRNKERVGIAKQYKGTKNNISDVISIHNIYNEYNCQIKME